MGKSLSHSRHVDLVKGTPADMQDKAEQDEARPDKTRQDNAAPHYTTLQKIAIQYHALHGNATQNIRQCSIQQTAPRCNPMSFATVRTSVWMHACMYVLWGGLNNYQYYFWGSLLCYRKMGTKTLL